MSIKTLKIIAIISMLLDHIGFAGMSLGMPSTLYYFLRTIGRLAMPLFCFMVAEGLFHTKDAKRYLLRLSIFALASEVPFDLFTRGEILEFGNQNVGFTLLFGLLGILLFDAFAAQNKKAAALAAILAAGAAAYFVRSDHTIFGIFYIFVCYYFRNQPMGRGIAIASGVLLGTLTNWITPSISWESTLISVAAVLAIIPMNLYNGERGKGGSSLFQRSIFYTFYPAHMLVLYFLRIALG